MAKAGLDCPKCHGSMFWEQVIDARQKFVEVICHCINCGYEPQGGLAGPMSPFSTPLYARARLFRHRVPVD